MNEEKLSYEEIDKRRLSLAKWLLSDEYAFRDNLIMDYSDDYCNPLPELLASDILYCHYGSFYVLPTHEEWAILTDKEADEFVKDACNVYCDSDCEYQWFMASYPEDAWKLVEKYGRGIALSAYDQIEHQISDDYFAFQNTNVDTSRYYYSKYGEIGDDSSLKKTDKERGIKL